MSEQNVEIVRRAFEAVSRRPKPDYDTVNALYHPDHELVTGIQQLEGGVAEGARGFHDFLIENAEAWERWEHKIEHMRNIDSDRVLLESMFTALSKHAGVPVEQSVAAIVTVREGKVVRTEFYSSRETALEAAGLSE